MKIYCQEQILFPQIFTEKQTKKKWKMLFFHRIKQKHETAWNLEHVGIFWDSYAKKVLLLFGLGCLAL